MKKLVLVLGSLISVSVAFNAQASSKTYVFEAVDQEPATKICLEAAKNGYASAKTLSKVLGVNFHEFKSTMTCNNLDIASFSKKYNPIENIDTFQETVEKKDVLVVISKEAEDMDASSQCMTAAMGGKIEDSNVRCNGKSIKSFAKRLAEKYNIVNASI